MKKALFVLAFILILNMASALYLDSEKKAICDLNVFTINGIHEIHASNCGVFRSYGNGIVSLTDDKGVNKGRLAFGSIVKVGGSVYYLSSWDAAWTWEILSLTDSNITVAGTASDSGLDWSQFWYFSDKGNPPKITNRLTNNTGFDLQDSQFLYLVDVNESTKKTIYYGDQNKYMYNWTIDIYNNNPPESWEKYIYEIDYGFNFQDLIDNNFNFSMLYLGNLNNLNDVLPDTNGYVVGVTKGNGIFPNGATVTLDPEIDVNASGNDFYVGNEYYRFWYDQSVGGTLNTVYDRIEDDAPFFTAQYASHWHQWRWRIGSSYYQSYDDPGRLVLNEDLNARVTIQSDAGINPSGGVADFNETHTRYHYPLDKGVKMYDFMEIQVDSDGSPVNYAINYYYINNTYQVWSGTDNDDGSPDGGDWWHMGRRTDATGADGNSVAITCYIERSGARFYNGKWNPTNAYGGSGGETDGRGGWYDSNLDPDFSADEYTFIQNMTIFLPESLGSGVCSDCYESQSATDFDKGFEDAICLDFRTPDNLFMHTGTTTGFDLNRGVYEVRATDNEVDFNISTNIGGTDVNRYYPAFEITNYTATTAPLLKYNGVEQTEGVDYISDVNTELNGQYAVVVWLGRILHTEDNNAQFTIAETFESEPDEDTCEVPASGTWTIDTGDICTLYNRHVVLYCGDLNVWNGSLAMYNSKIDFNFGYGINTIDLNAFNADYNNTFRWLYGGCGGL